MSERVSERERDRRDWVTAFVCFVVCVCTMIENWWCWCVCHHLVCVRGCNQSRQKVDEVVTRLVLCKSAQSWSTPVVCIAIHALSVYTCECIQHAVVLSVRASHTSIWPLNKRCNTSLTSAMTACKAKGNYVCMHASWMCVSYKKELSKNWGSIGDHSFPTKLPGASQDWTNVSPQFSWRHWSFYQRALRHFSKKK